MRKECIQCEFWNRSSRAGAARGSRSGVRMHRRFAALTLAATIPLAACGDEDPVGLGGLLPGAAVRTVEVILEAPQFLEWDSVRPGLSRPAGAGYLVVAEDFGGAVDAHALVRFASLPRSVTYDSAGATDTLPSFTGGEVVVRVDTVRTLASVPVRLALFSIGEAWDPRSATWALRVDSGGVELPWIAPGGTPGALVDTLTYAPGDSLLSFAVDSQTVALWGDTANAARGAVIVAETPGARIRLDAVRLRLRLQVRPSVKPDTIVTDSVGLVGSTFVYDPPAVSDGPLLIGGIQGWRSFVRFRQRLDTLTFACPDGPPDCRLRLDQATLNYAALQLRPVDPPPGYLIGDTLLAEARSAVEAPGVPLIRTPLASRVGAAAISPTLFNGGGVFEMSLTALTGAFLREERDGDIQPARTLALVDFREGDPFGNSGFGIGSFGAIGSDAAPRLRLILSVTSEVQLR